MQPKPYTAVRLVREKGKDEFDRHFTVDWDSARELFDPSRLFQMHAGDAPAGEVWALWHTPIGPGWRTYADTHKPAFMLIKHFTWEALMIDDAYGSEIRELSVNREEVTT
jgi:hypothetical protein